MSGRRTVTVTITANGRDKGKAFLLTEMPASQAEEWAMRAFVAISKSGAQVPEEYVAAGMAGLAMSGLHGLKGIDFADLKPLLDEMFECIQAVPDPKRPEVIRRLVEDDTEEVATRLQLREEVLSLHLGFSLRELTSRLKPLLSMGGSLNIGTSPVA